MEYLKNNYNVDVSGDLITSIELIDLGCNYSYGNTCTTSPYKWLYSTSYWIKNDLRYSKKANYVTYDGFFNGFDYDMLYADTYFGVRPVISFNIKYINKYNVTFVDYDGKVLKTEEVEYGKGATAPVNPTREGYTFVKWDKDFSNITEDIIVTAEYSINTYNVIFKDYDGTVLKTEEVEYGKSATAPKNPTRKGYTFTKWDKDFSNITSDLTVTAVYTKKQSSDIDITPYMFNAKFYADANPDVKKEFGNNWKQYFKHYMIWGQKEYRECI